MDRRGNFLTYHPFRIQEQEDGMDSQDQLSEILPSSLFIFCCFQAIADSLDEVKQGALALRSQICQVNKSFSKLIIIRYQKLHKGLYTTYSVSKRNIPLLVPDQSFPGSMGKRTLKKDRYDLLLYTAVHLAMLIFFKQSFKKKKLFWKLCLSIF